MPKYVATWDHTCPECGNEMNHKSSSGVWDCPNGDCDVWGVKLTRKKNRGAGLDGTFYYEISKVMKVSMPR
jgi:ribosomal protein L37AE/L43A